MISKGQAAAEIIVAVQRLDDFGMVWSNLWTLESWLGSITRGRLGAKALGKLQAAEGPVRECCDGAAARVSDFAGDLADSGSSGLRPERRKKPRPTRERE